MGRPRLSETKLQKIGALLAAGYSIRATGKALGIHRETIRRYAAKLEPATCTCGREIRHRGNCRGAGARYLRSQAHKEVVAKINSDYREPAPRPISPKTKLRFYYPYCTGPAGQGNALITAVDAVVSKWIPDQFRADICQDLCLAILENRLAVEDLTKDAAAVAARRELNMFSRQTTYSLDAPLWKDGDDVIRLLDIIPSDYEPILAKRSVRRKSAA